MFGLDTALTLLLIFCLLAALSFEFINGFHDTANAVATVIYTHTLKPGQAVVWSGIWNFIGVHVGGIAVAMGIIHLLPLEVLTDTNIFHNLALVLALIFTAILWNLGTWYLGIPCSSSHTLIGSIFGVGIAYMLFPGNHDISLNWKKAEDIGISLLTSPLIGFFLAMGLMVILMSFVSNKAIFKEPPAKKAPPMWIRSILVLTCTFVSFSHGSNDGQKGIGLIMIILIAIIPARFALDQKKDPLKLHGNINTLHTLFAQVDTSGLQPNVYKDYQNITARIDSLNLYLGTAGSFSEVSRSNGLNIRRDILVISKKSPFLLKKLSEGSGTVMTSQWVSACKAQIKEMDEYTEYAPWWVIFSIALSLGLGTMIGWKRIVVTIGEKIGKTHLSYAQGASAELIAATTITASSWLGLPVSTTHVLSSGVAGTMVADSGYKNLQKKTIAAIGIAWLITLPVTILFSGLLYLLLRLILG